MLSVIVPIYQEEKYIAKCIDSMLNQDYPKDDLEIILVDGMSKDRTREIVATYTAQYPFIRLIDNPERIAPCAMNRGIKEAKGDVIIRLDAHVYYPKNYFSLLVEKLNELPEAENVGALCNTLPVNDSLVAQSIAAVLSSSFGMGNSHFRVGADKEMEVDTVPFGCFHRSIFDKVGLYDEELVRNQDDELNARIIKAGGKIYLIPQLVCEYYARDTAKKVYKMFYQYGVFKPLVNKKLGSPATVRQFFPLCFVAGLLVGPIVCVFLPVLWWAYFAVILIWVMLATFFSLKDSKNLKRILIQNWIYFVVHFGYGWGYIVGIYKILFHRPFVVQVNR
ncbi:MAG: glycosyltransferase family 2 protein [Bacteroidaceae bacterium]